MRFLHRSARSLAVLACLGLAACASTQEEASERNDARKAAELNTQLGREYMTRGQYEVALEKLKKAVTADEGFAPAHTMLAVLYETIGEDDNARRHYEAALRAAPDNGDVNNNYGSFLCRVGDGKGANRYFETALEDPFYRTPAVAMTNAGSCALERGELDQAETYLRQALAYDPNFADALLTLAALNYEREDYLRARAFLQRFEVRGATTAESLMLGYRIETALSNAEMAGQYRNQLIQQFPAAAETLEVQGRRSG